VPGQPLFERVLPNACGIVIFDLLEEGALFFDYDLDGDLDLVCVYSGGPGVRVWESRGDGTFSAAPPGVVASPMIGLDLGVSAEDWDNDGDLDLTTRQVFRRNLLAETGVASFSVATHSIPAQHVTSATPAWGDWDRDGDLDCALGNWSEVGRFYENTLYGPSTPAGERRYVRVHPVRWSTTHGRLLETEYGTSVEVRLRDPEEVARRVKFTSSAAGYLNQNEYALHFGLPGDPYPNDPQRDVVLDVVADFPATAQSAPWRVDRFVNPRLGSIALAGISDRQIRVFRAGEVVVDGTSYGPTSVSPQLDAAAGGLGQPSASGGLPEPAPAPHPWTWAGVAFDTATGAGPTYVVAVDVDGELGLGSTCASPPFNLALWDVTDPRAPLLAEARLARTSSANARTRVPFEVVLPPGRRWRLVAHVASSRATAIAGPVDHGRLRVLGGLLYPDVEPCRPAAVLAAAVHPAAIRLAPLFHQ
jgi:hypothetical protein